VATFLGILKQALTLVMRIPRYIREEKFQNTAIMDRKIYNQKLDFLSTTIRKRIELPSIGTINDLFNQVNCQKCNFKFNVSMKIFTKILTKG